MLYAVPPAVSDDLPPILRSFVNVRLPPVLCSQGGGEVAKRTEHRMAAAMGSIPRAAGTGSFHRPGTPIGIVSGVRTPQPKTTVDPSSPFAASFPTRDH